MKTAAKCAVLAGFAAVVAGTVASAAEKPDPALGVEMTAKRGWSFETQVGVFTAFGGSRAASNAQPFTAVSIGLDLPQLAPGLSVFFAAAHGANAGSCRSTVKPVNGDGCTTYQAGGVDLVAPQDFSVIPLELGARYALAEIVPRLTVNGTLAFGYSILTPTIVKDAPLGAPHVGLGAGLDYATRVEGLSVGAEVLFRMAVSPLLPSLAAYPRIRFVF